MVLAMKYSLHHRMLHPGRCRNGGLIEPLENRLLLAGVGAFFDGFDIGSPSQAGFATYSNGTYTVNGGGADIGGSSDQFHFINNPLVGDTTIIADVTSILNTNTAAKAGIMIRNGPGASAAYAGIFVTPSSGIIYSSRAADGGTAGQFSLFGFSAPRFLRLTRSGSSISAYQSANGSTWSQLGPTQTIGFGADALVGLAVTSRNPSALSVGTFTNVSVLPAEWSDGDIGSPAMPGSAVYDPATNQYVLSGGGAGIGAAADQLNFASRSMTGDGSILARLDELVASDPLAQAGIMVRDSNAAGAAFASLTRTAGSNLMFQWRSATNAAASSVTIATALQPLWLKIVRQDDRFSARYSANGVLWTTIGAEQSIPMTGATALAGLAAAAHNGSTLAESTFSGVSVLRGGWNTRDVGSPALAGSITHDPARNTDTLVFGGTSDQLHFASRTLAGDGSVVTYVNSITSDAITAKAGVMIRASDAPDAAFAGLFVSPDGVVRFEARTAAGSPVLTSTVGALAPVSFKLARTGNSFAAWVSTNGVTWSQVGPVRTIAMPQSVPAGIAASSDAVAVSTASLTGTAVGVQLPPGAGVYSAADELFLHDLEQRSVRFFFDETNPATGLVPDGALANGGSNGSASSIASVGFGLSALTIGDRRGWLTHAEAYQRALTTINFLYNSGAHVNGFFYHFLNASTGQRAWDSELSSIDTALLMAGVLNVASYWKGTALETAANNLFNRVNWPWMLMPNGQFYGHWTPEGGFGGGYVDFSEAVLLYLLGLGSPTHPTARSTWTSWPRTPVINYGGYNFVTATTRALFTVQYPMGWFDLRGLTDSTGLNYFANAQTATLAQRQMFVDLSPTYPHYGINNWGATAADGPNGYTVWGGPPATGNIDGSIVPTAPGGSLAFTPRQSIDALKYMQQTYGATVYKKYAFVDAFNPHISWTSAIVLGLDAGMMLLAAENSRSNFVWDIFEQHAVARQAVASAFPTVTPTLLGATTRKTHGGSGIALDQPISLVSETLAVEERAGGPTQLVLTFGANIVKGANFAVSLTNSLGQPNGTVSSTTVSGSTLTINLAGAANAQTLVVNVADVRHYAMAASGSYSFRLGVLAGDANRDGTVDITDLGILATNWQLTSTGALPADFDFNGVVDITDLGILATNWQLSLLSPAASSAAPARRQPLRPAGLIDRGAVSPFARQALTIDSVRIGILKDDQRALQPLEA